MGKKNKSNKRANEGNSEGYKKARRSASPEASLEGAMSCLHVLEHIPKIFDDPQMKVFRSAVYPLLAVQRHAHFEPSVDKPPLDKSKLNADTISATILVAEYCKNNLEYFNSSEMKPFRRALHPLVKSVYGRDKEVTPGGGQHQPRKGALLTAYFQAKKWHEALALIREWATCCVCDKYEEEVKLGTMQRWTRYCSIDEGDLEPEAKRQSLSHLLLDALLRLIAAINGAQGLPVTETVDGGEEHCRIEHLPSFQVATAEGTDPHWDQASRRSEGSYEWRIVKTTEGVDRRPPRADPLHYYQTSPNALIWTHPDPTNMIKRHDVPGCPGAFVLTDVLDPDECAQLRAMSESIDVGYIKDAVDGIDTFNMLAHSTLLEPLYDRCKSLLPSSLTVKGHKRHLRGLNARLRFFRYFEHAHYRPHIDGAWPGSGLREGTGEFTDDLWGDRHSQLTFLVYLNGGFTGGHTTFYASPSPGSQQRRNDKGDSEEEHSNVLKWGHVQARSVVPRQGSVLVFPHGSSDSPVHEGSPVTIGTKYVIRTDVLYSL